MVIVVRRCLTALAALVLSGLTVLSNPVSRPSADYLVDLWQTDQGLPQATVTSIVQSPEGYLWMGTFNGLVRFDGTQFRVLNPANTPGLGSGRIVQLFLDKSGGLWIGSEEGQVFRFANGKFQEFTPPSHGSTARLARQMCEDGRGGLWLLTFESSILRLVDGSFQGTEVGAIRGDGGVLGIAADGGGTLWAVTKNRVCLWQNDEFKTIWPAIDARSECRGITKAREGGVWVACADSHHLWLRRFTEEGLVAETGPFPKPTRPIYSMLQDRQGRVWIGMLGGGVYRCDTLGQMVEIGARQGLPTNFVRTLCEDTEGDIWVGMQGGGLARLKPALFSKYRKADGLSADQVLSVAEGEPGELWVGTNGEWLNRIRRNRIEAIDEDSGLRNSSTWSVLRDRQKTVWVGTWGGGLFRSEGDRFFPVTPVTPDNPNSGLVPGAALSPIVLALFEDSQGSLWLGQHSYGSITRLVNGKPVVLSIPGAPSNFDVRAIGEDQNGAIWIGSHGSGLYRYLDGCFTRFSKTNGLHSDYIWALHTDSDGAVWIGTYQGGISCFHRNRLLHPDPREAMPSDVICQILEDNDGNLWFGSYGGIFTVSRAAVRSFLSGKTDKLDYHLFTKADGLPTLECTGGFQPSGCKMQDGRLCFPTVKGLAVIHPKKAIPSDVGPEVKIEEVLVDGTKVWDSITQSTGLSPESGGSGKAQVVLDPQNTRLEVRYTGISLAAPDQVTFQHQLRGLDVGWIPAGSARAASYSKLPPGHYAFQVMARSGAHTWSLGAAQLSVHVLPYFWQTTTFQVCAVLLVAALVAGLGRAVERRRQLQRLAAVERQQDLERERLRIARDIHDDLGARLTEITLLSELAADDAVHGVPTQADLGRISSKARDLTRSVDEIVWAVNPSHDNLESLVIYACGYAEDYLKPLQIRCRFSVPRSIPKTPLPADVRHHVFLAFKEALANVAKHSKATEVTILFSSTTRWVMLSVSDNGVGWQGEEEPACLRNGLGNMRHRLQQLGGRCDIVNSPGAGVRVTFSIPHPEP